MIRVIKSGDHIEVSGHALFAEYGKDIVCAAVSSIVITTVNGISSIDDKAINCLEKDGFISVDVVKHSKEVDALISNMMNLLKELEIQYKKNIRIEEVR